MERIASKDEERETLKKIKEMVKALGEDSYLSAAFEGCFDIAEDNITNDFCNSPKRAIEALRSNLENSRKRETELQDKIRELKKENQELQYSVWVPYTDPRTYPLDKWVRLSRSVEAAGKKPLTADEAVDIVSREFGFSKDFVKIEREIPVYEVNAKHVIREGNGKIELVPLYLSSDWNYIRFSCGGYAWEMQDGELVNVTM